MFTFECKDMRIDCDYVATAETKIEVLDIAKTHALETHNDLFAGPHYGTNRGETRIAHS